MPLTDNGRCCGQKWSTPSTNCTRRCFVPLLKTCLEKLGDVNFKDQNFHRLNILQELNFNRNPKILVRSFDFGLCHGRDQPNLCVMQMVAQKAANFQNIILYHLDPKASSLLYYLNWVFNVFILSVCRYVYLNNWFCVMKLIGFDQKIINDNIWFFYKVKYK